MGQIKVDVVVARRHDHGLGRLDVSLFLKKSAVSRVAGDREAAERLVEPFEGRGVAVDDDDVERLGGGIRGDGGPEAPATDDDNLVLHMRTAAIIA